MGRIGLIGSYPLKSEEETKAFGAFVAKELVAPAVLALYGDLGAGKTTFVQGLAEALGIFEPVQSPTFILLNLYEGLAHFDLYRLKNGSDFMNLGFCEYFEAPLISAIEWPEKIKDLLPPNTIHIHFEYTESDSKIGRCQGGAPLLSQAKPAPKQTNLEGWSIQADLKSGGCPTQVPGSPKAHRLWGWASAEPTFEPRAVYIEGGRIAKIL